MRLAQQLRGWHAGGAHQGVLGSQPRLPRGQRGWGVRCDAAQPGPGSTQPYTAATVSGTAGVLPQQQAPHTDAGSSSSSQGVDHFKAAGHRLERLLAGVGDGEDEFFDQMILEQSPEQKLLLSGVAGGVLTGGALFLCWLCQLDPLGGASLSLESAQAAAWGALVSLPLVLLKAYLWSDHAKREFSWVEDWHKNQVECFRPLMHRLTPLQTSLFVATEVLPGVLILLPAAMGGLQKLTLLCADYLGTPVPDHAAQAGALVATAALAGVAKLAENAMSYEEYQVIKDAMENSDRYYRLMAMNKDSTPGDARRAATAFQAVALTWMARSQLVSQLAAVLATIEVAYLGVMWHESGDLAAPVVAALAAAAVDFSYIRKEIMQQRVAE